MTNNQPLTGDDIKDLAHSNQVEAALVRWSDTGELCLVSQQNFNNISYEHERRAHEVVITQSDLETLAGTDEPAELSDFQFSELARCLNEQPALVGV